MAELKSIANQLACSGTTGANTGKLGCLSLFGTPTHLLAFPRGKEIPGNTDFGLDFLTAETQKGSCIPIIDASAFEDVSAEDTYSTNTSGIKRLNLKGLPEYRLTFEEGHEFYRQLAKLEGFKNFSFAIGDDNGNWMIVKKSNGNFAGFTAGHITPELTNRKVKGGDAESKSILIQFLDRLEWDKNYAILHADKVGFIPSEVPTVNGVNFHYDEIPTAGTTLKVKATLAADNNTLVEGFVKGDFKVQVNGEDAVVSEAVEDNPGVYTITLGSALSASDKVRLYTYDADKATRIILNQGILYKAEYAEVEAIAAA